MDCESFQSLHGTVAKSAKPWQDHWRALRTLLYDSTVLRLAWPGYRVRIIRCVSRVALGFCPILYLGATQGAGDGW